MIYAAVQIFRNGREKIGYAVFCLMLAALMIQLPACGKKGPPTPPTYVPPPVVEGLSIVIEEDTAKLLWQMPERDKKNENALAGFYVYHSKTALTEAECKDCPVRYKKAADIGIENYQADGSYTERLEKGYRYFFTVSVYTDRGDEGEKSAAVTIDY